MPEKKGKKEKKEEIPPDKILIESFGIISSTKKIPVTTVLESELPVALSERVLSKEVERNQPVALSKRVLLK